MRGKFITFEGIDGAGKTTHIAWFADFLRGQGVAVTLTREPGGTRLGERLRELILDRAEPLHAETETLLLFAARCEHLDKVILPGLAAGSWVLCDRFTDATYAYQSGGSGVPWARIAELERWVHRDIQPNATILLDLPPHVGRERSRGARLPDRFEREEHAFFDRVREAYLRRAREHPDRIRVVDASGDLGAVRTKLEEIARTLCSN
jgi:dTMP kinase